MAAGVKCSASVMAGGGPGFNRLGGILEAGSQPALRPRGRREYSEIRFIFAPRMLS